MRHLQALLVLIALLFPSAAQAHGHRWDFSLAPSSADGSRLWGGRVSFGITNKVPANEDLSWLIDLTNLKDRDSSQDITLMAYFGGLRYAVVPTSKHLLMLHGLVGAIDKHQGATGRTDFAMMLGAAYEWVPRGLEAGWALRVQADHSFVPEKSVKGYTQFSVGVVKRFD